MPDSPQSGCHERRALALHCAFEPCSVNPQHGNEGRIRLPLPHVRDRSLGLVHVAGSDAATPAIMRAMLGANLLGSSTEAGRLAPDVVKDEAVYCERWVVADLSEAAVARRLAGFVDTAAFWLTAGTDTIIEDTGRLDDGRTPAPVEARPTANDALTIRL